MPRTMRKFLNDERGAILVFWGITLVIIFGIVAMSFDIGRIASTHEELQSFSDQVALAAAGELDGNADAITRANNAAAGMISGTQTFGTGSHLLSGSTDYSIAYYATLPSSDSSALGTPLDTSNLAAASAAAQYVSVTATPRSVGLTFAAVLYKLLGQPVPTTLVGATAVAGFTQYACDITPMMFCTPHDYKADNHVGDMILLRSGGSGAAWQPGDFGFLDPTSSGFVADPNGPCAGLSGNKYFQCLLAAQGNITQCFSTRGVNTEPGQKNGIENAIWNVRFDIFQSSMQNINTGPTAADYPAAPNVIKSIIPKSGSCIKTNGGQPSYDPSNPQPTDTMGLPPDSCFAAGTCSYNNRFGDGNWDSADYLAMNWPGGAPSGWNGKSRWSLYNAEIAAGGGAGATTDILSGKNQTGRPICSAYQSSYPERRVIVAAAVDCAANPISGSETGVPVSEFVKLFLTQPVGADATNSAAVDIYAEIVGTAEGAGGAGGTGGLFHDVVQLYR